MHAKILGLTQQARLLFDQSCRLWPVSLCQKCLSIQLAQYCKRQSKGAQMIDEMVWHLGAQGFCQHAQCPYTAVALWSSWIALDVGPNMRQGPRNHLLTTDRFHQAEVCAEGICLADIGDALGTPSLQQIIEWQGSIGKPFRVVDQNMVLLNCQNHHKVVASTEIVIIRIIGKVAHIQWAKKHWTLLACRAQSSQSLLFIPTTFQSALPAQRLYRTRQSPIRVQTIKEKKFGAGEIGIAKRHGSKTL